MEWFPPWTGVTSHSANGYQKRHSPKETTTWYALRKHSRHFWAIPQFLHLTLLENHRVTCSRSFVACPFKIQLPPIDKYFQKQRKSSHPIGWLTPIPHITEMLIQRLWTFRLNWDELNAENLVREFNSEIEAFNVLKDFNIIHFISDCDSVEHCFADASILAYAAAVHLITVKIIGERTSHLDSKAKPINLVQNWPVGY